jgi:hypothetical protein
MVIEGNAAYIPNEEFEAKVQQALDLLKEKAGTHYTSVTTYVDKIRADKASGAFVQRAIVDIARPTFDGPLEWLASVLVHETRHISLFREKLEHSGKEAELECNRVQLEALRLIGAPQYLIAGLLAEDGEHFDLDGDGKHTYKDDKLRTW